MRLKAEGLHPGSNGTQKTPPFAKGAPFLRPFLRQGRQGKQDGAPKKANAEAQSRAMCVLVRPTPSIAWILLMTREFRSSELATSTTT